MKYSVSVAALFWVVVIMILQPILSYRDYLIEAQIKSNTNYLAQVAAVEGYVTDGMRQQIVNNLSRIGFSESEVQITYSATRVERGTRIDVAITAPRAPSFPYVFSSEPDATRYYARANIMSEYLD